VCSLFTELAVCVVEISSALFFLLTIMFLRIHRQFTTPLLLLVIRAREERVLQQYHEYYIK